MYYITPEFLYNIQAITKLMLIPVIWCQMCSFNIFWCGIMVIKKMKLLKVFYRVMSIIMPKSKSSDKSTKSAASTKSAPAAKQAKPAKSSGKSKKTAAAVAETAAAPAPEPLLPPRHRSH